MAASHQQADFFKRRLLRIDLARDLSFVNDQQTIGKTRHFLELGGDEQDRAAVVTQTDQLTMNELDRADIDAARRLRHQQQLRRDVIFTTDDQLLLIAPRKRTRGQCCVWWTNVETLNDLRSTSLHRVFVDQNSGDRRAIVHAEDRVFSETEVKQESASMTIFGDVWDARS